jgi:uncharacterized protein (DUF697 family)
MPTKSRATALHAQLAESLDHANTEPHAKKRTSPMSTHTTHRKSSHAKADAGEESVSLSAQKIINGSMLLAAGAGAIPVPIWDTAAIMAVQVKMIGDLAAHYGVPFQKNLGKTALAALIGGLAPGLLAQGSAGMFLKILPGIGSLFGAIAQPAFAAGLTYGVGKVFVSHFEGGGSLVDFDAKDFKDTLTSEVKAGIKKVSELKI